MSIVLADQQNVAMKQILDWMKDPKRKRFVLGGYAGTGKTVLAQHISKIIGGTLFCAYTGKAANVLRERGCDDAGTIHSFLYKLVKEENGRPHFRRCHPWESAFMNAKLVVVDEFSMLQESIVNDIESLAKKVLYLGDPFQLMPVTGVCNIKPDYVLTEIHRQALESPVLRAATAVREGKCLPYCNDGEFRFLPRAKLQKEEWLNHDQIIVGYNHTRQKVNAWVRQQLGFSGRYPVQGEKLMCLKNNAELGVFNGQIETANCSAYDVENKEYSIDWGDQEEMKVWAGDIDGSGDKYFFNRSNPLERLDYAYAATAHKLQGSEFYSTIIINQPLGRDQTERNRWIYTALTRAKVKATLTDAA
jgi:exodeoxyribonuclease-5